MSTWTSGSTQLPLLPGADVLVADLLMLHGRKGIMPFGFKDDCHDINFSSCMQAHRAGNA